MPHNSRQGQALSRFQPLVAIRSSSRYALGTAARGLGLAPSLVSPGCLDEREETLAQASPELRVARWPPNTQIP